MSSKVVEILNKNGPMLSGEMAELLEQIFNMTNETARQTISRSKSPVYKLKSLSFQKNQSYLYLEEQYNSKQYKTKLIEAIKNSSKAYYTIILAIKNNGGYISKNILPAFTNIPLGNIKGHKRFDVMIVNLINAGIISDFDDYYQIDPFFFPEYKLNMNRTKAIELAKKTVIDDFYTWARTTNFVSYNSGRTLYEHADFCQFQWCFTAPTYLNDLKDLKSGNPGFIVADILLGTRVDIETIEFFIEKIKIVKSFKNTSSFIPVLITDNLSKPALEMLKNNGVLCAVISNFFDSSYDKTLKELINILTNSNAILLENPNALTACINEINSLEGRLGNMIGVMFELCVAQYYIKRGCVSHDINKNINHNGQKKEIDVLVIRDGKCIIIECKGIKSTLDDSYVEKWISNNVPLIYKWASKSYPDHKIEFELWCTGGFTDLGKNKLKIAKETTKKYKINTIEKDEIKKLAKDYNCGPLKKFIDSYDKN